MSSDFLDALRQSVADSLRDRLPGHGVDPADVLVDAVALGVAMDIAYAWAGQPIYVQQRSDYLEKRIMSDYTGDNIPELVSRYRLATRTIYDILNRQRRAAGQARGDGQLKLPGM